MASNKTTLACYTLSSSTVCALTRICGMGNSDDTSEPWCEFDSHADTCVGGSNTCLMGPPDRMVTVSAFAPGYGSKDYPIGTVGTVWTNPTTGHSHLLVFHEAIYLGDDSPGTLLNPNQLRMAGVRVDDCPQQFDSRSSHSVHHPELTIPLSLRGIFSGFASRRPTEEDINRLKVIELTGTAQWEPNSNHFAAVEDSVNVSALHMNDPEEACSRNVSAAKIVEQASDELRMLDDLDIAQRLISSVNVTLDPELRDELTGTTPAYEIKAMETEDILFQPSPEPVKVSRVTIEGTKPKITPEQLSKSWGIGLQTAKRTLQVTTQAGLRNIYAPSERKVRLKAPWLKFPSVNTKIYCDALKAQVPSIGKEIGASVFTDGKGFDSFYPFPALSKYPNSLMSFIHDFGVPKTLITDGASEMQKGVGRQIANEYKINLKVTVPYSPWQNKAETTVRELKRYVRRVTRRKNAPKRLWSFAGKWGAAIRRLTALDIPELEGRTPMENVTGSTPNITPYAMFDWYQPVYFHQPTSAFPHQRRDMGRLIGVADNCTDELAYVVLPKSGIPLIRKSIWAIPPERVDTDEVMADILELDMTIRDKYGDHKLRLNSLGQVKATDLYNTFGLDDFPEPPPDLFEGDEADPLEFVQPDEQLKDADDYTPEALDQYLAAELLMPHGDGMQRARVRRRHQDEQGRPLGTANANPILDSRMYEIEFPDGATDVVTANLIAENLYSQIDNEGRQFLVLKDIVDHKFTDEAVSTENGYVLSNNGQRRPVITTKGCELMTEFADGSSHWVPLKDLKISNPVEVAEYALANKVDGLPCFNWWVRKVLKKRDRIIKKVKSRYWKRTHKYGVELPHSVQEALAIDAKTNTTFWRDAILKEMKNVGMAFEFPEDGKIPIGYKEIRCHMIFDIKSDLTRKARFVAGGHLTDPPKDSVFSSVVTRDSVRIAFTIAALNGLEVLAGDVQNAYLNAPTKEKCFFKAGLEFGADKVNQPVLIVRALYGLKSSGARWRDHMAATLRDAGFASCYADPDVWMRKACKPDGTPYWEYVLCYVDDVLVISHKPKVIMDYLASCYTMKKGSVKEPDEYLGTQIKRYNLNGDQQTWAMSSDLYVKRAIADVETELEKVGQTLRGKVSTPMTTDYRPELDQSPELDARRANYYQGLIGVLRWIIEIGRVDIMVAVSMLSRFLANPRVGHLEEALHIFAYLKQHNHSAIVFDHTRPVFDESRFAKCDWSGHYPDAKEPVPPRAPDLLGEAVTMTCFVDADHAGCRETRRSHTGIIIFLQRTPITWYSKRQNTVETSSFGSEFVAMKTAVEQVEAMRYKLRMMGVPVDGPTNVFCDNESVFKNATRTESTLKKKHNAIAYHRTREAIAAGIIRVAWEDGRFNIADVLTKLLAGPKLRQLISCILD